MKELFFQLWFSGREQEKGTVPTAAIRVPEDKVRDFVKELRAKFDAGYDIDEVGSRDQWATDILDAVVAKYDGVWSYARVDGLLIIE